jgi:tetratricopeptide (TPR) repeat protein
VLEVLTQGQVNAISLQKASDEDILELFFQHLIEHRILLVFDNIDHYVDLENQQAIGMMNQLIERATTVPNSGQIILTSRPILHYESNRFFSMEVTGLKMQETEELFKLRGAVWDGPDKSEQVQSVLNITKGSALQLNLIATQVANRGVSLSNLIKRIQEGTAPEAQDRVLQEVWSTLKPQHQEVLRVMAELPHPEPEQRVGDCLADSMNYNRFGKAIRALKSLNLIVKKPAANSGEVIELHPLVRHFIRKRYPKEDQEPIVKQIIHFFERMVGRYKGRPEMGSIAVLADWISKIEVCLDNDRPGEALSSLKEISAILLSRGYVEEFVRLGSLVLTQYKVQGDPAELMKLDSVSEDLVRVLGDLGRYDEAAKWIDVFAGTVAGKSARYIWLCNVRAYAYWIQGKFDQAKITALEGFQLKVTSKIDTTYDCAHTLALARRDSGEVAEALTSFLQGIQIENVLTPGLLDEKLGGPFYGNIGRCLQFLNRNAEALICLKKSAYLLERGHDVSNILLNRGYAAMWLGEVLTKMNEPSLAYIAFRSASGRWKVVSPTRSKEALQKADLTVERLSDPTLVGRGDWECDEMYLDWLKV